MVSGSPSTSRTASGHNLIASLREQHERRASRECNELVCHGTRNAWLLLQQLLRLVLTESTRWTGVLSQSDQLAGQQLGSVVVQVVAHLRSEHMPIVHHERVDPACSGDGAASTPVLCGRMSRPMRRGAYFAELLVGQLAHEVHVLQEKRGNTEYDGLDLNE